MSSTGSHTAATPLIIVAPASWYRGWTPGFGVGTDERRRSISPCRFAAPEAIRLLGKRVAAACGTSTSGGRVYDKVFTWPAERASVEVDLARDISSWVAYCLIEDARSGGDIALVKFRR